MSKDDPRKKIIDLMQHAKKKKRKKKTGPTKGGKRQKISVKGNSNITAGGDVYHSPTIRPKVQVKTGDGVIDASQKAELQRLIGEWIETRTAVRRSKFSWPAAWSAFNKSFGINSYHELPAEEFGRARKWVQVQIGIINNMTSAPKKAPNWRTKKIAAIKARCKNQLDNPRAYESYIQSQFGQTSLAKLEDDQLQATYQHVFSKR